MDHHNYKEINRKLWNAKTGVHVSSEFYDVDSFRKGENALKEIELGLLGDVMNKSVLHLQCHFGIDSLSLSRMGAIVTGVDLSDAAITEAGKLALELDLRAEFICSDIYDLPGNLDQKFDVVFSSYGTIGWLPDIDEWAGVVSHFLKPGGKFVFVEFHPVVWMFDNDFNEISYSYFISDPIIEHEESTYADRNSSVGLASVTWNHSLGEVVSALLKKGLHLNSFKEYDYSPYNCLEGMKEISPGRFIIEKWDNKVPLVYSLVCSSECPGMNSSL